MIRLVLAVAVALTVAGCDKEESERYTDACHSRGGFVSRDDNGWHSRWTCVGQTSGEQLPELKL